MLIAGIDTYRRSVIYELESLLATQREKSSGHLKKFCRNYCGVLRKVERLLNFLINKLSSSWNSKAITEMQFCSNSTSHGTDSKNDYQDL